MKQMKSNKLYRVWWYDIEHENKWMDKTEPFAIPELMENVWYYWGKNKGFYYFGSGQSKTQHFERVAIPKGCVVKYKEV